MKISFLSMIRDPWEMLKEGDFSHIELMMGTNQDEGIELIHSSLCSFHYLVNAFNWDGWIFMSMS